MKGTLSVTIHSVRDLQKTELSGFKPVIKVSFQEKEYQTASKKLKTPTFEEVFKFKSEEMMLRDVVTLELLSGNDTAVLASATVKFSEISNSKVVKKELPLMKQSNELGVLICSFEFISEKKNNNKSTANQVVKKEQFPSLSNNLVVSPRTKYLRVSYFYDMGKNVYGYTTSLRGLQTLASYGEQTTNYMLSKLGIKTIESTKAIDSALVPLLTSLDNNIDVKINSVLTTLVNGQNYVLQKKDAVLSKVIETTNSTIEHAKRAKDTTTKTVQSASSSTYKTLSGAAVFLISYVPIVGKKVLA